MIWFYNYSKNLLNTAALNSGGEVDTRGCYSAVCIAKVLNLDVELLAQKA